MRHALGLVLSLLALAACKDEVRDIDDDGDGCFGDCVEPSPQTTDRLAVEGRVCTEISSVMRPRKVLFLLDRSGSWQLTDPDDARVEAINDFFAETAGRPDISMGMIAFNGAMQVTPFTPEYQTFSSALWSAYPDGQSDLQGALATAAHMLEMDIQSSNDILRATTRYDVILVGDGPPDPVCLPGCGNDGDCRGYCDGPVGDPSDYEGLFVDLTPCEAYNTDEALLARVDEIRTLEQEYGIGGVRLHTAFVHLTPEPNIPPSCADEAPFDRAAAEDLYRRLADHGGGTFVSSDSSKGVELPDVDLRVHDPEGRRLLLAALYAWNLSAGPDSDGDGLVDVAEETAGTDPLSIDTDEDGYRDLLEQRLSTEGWDPLDPALPVVPCGAEDEYGHEDFDGDRLTNCEESFLGTNYAFHDSDFDLIGDGHELLRGTDPRVADTTSDLDGDGLSNAEELLTGMDPAVADADRWAREASRIALNDEGDGCYSFVLENIGLSDTLDEGWNTILITAAQEMPDLRVHLSFPRMACIRARLSGTPAQPAASHVTLTDDDFVDFVDLVYPASLDLERDCVGGL